MIALTIACEGWALALWVIAFVFARERSAREALRALLPAALALLLAGLAGRALKELWNVPRPLSVLGPDAVHVLLEPLRNRSFPSGHSASAAAVALFALRRYGSRAWPLVLLALGGGISRLYVGAHWTLDVLSGWAVGAIAGLAAEPAGRAVLAASRALGRLASSLFPPPPTSAASPADPGATCPAPARRARTLVCLPTYDERENLGPMLAALFAVDAELHVLVIDDGSPDGTGALADEIAAREPRLFVLHRPAKEGLGKAYLAGFAWALERAYDLVVEMDADFSHDPRALPALLARAQDADLVLGSRYVAGGGTRGWGPLRRLLSAGGSLYARTILGLPIRDLTGGFKCFRRGVLEAVDLASVGCSGYAFQIELTHRAHRAGFRVAEVPILFVDRRVGRSKMSGRIVLEAIVKVWEMRLAAFAGAEARAQRAA